MDFITSTTLYNKTLPTFHNKTFKLILAGDGGVGKTTFVRRCVTGRLDSKYMATIGVEVHPYNFYINKDIDLCFNIWDTAGQEKFGGLRDGYYIQGECAIVMFDLQNRLSFKNARNWAKDIRRVCGEIPMVLVGTKADCKGNILYGENKNDVVASIHKLMAEFSAEFYEISSKSTYNIDKPFKSLFNKLVAAQQSNKTTDDIINTTDANDVVTAVDEVNTNSITSGVDGDNKNAKNDQEQNADSADSAKKGGLWGWFGY